MKGNRRFALVALLALTLAICVHAQELGTVEGIVTTSGTADGLAGVTVTLTAGTRQYTGTTGNDGRFSVKAPAGRYRPTAHKVNHVGSLRPPGPATFIELGAGQRVRDVKLELNPPSAVSGRVLDQDGNPAEGVQVNLLAESYLLGMRLVRSLGPDSTTNDRGEFRLGPVLPGEYWVVASPPNRQRDFAPSYYPGVTLLDDAMKIVVPLGRELYGVSFALTPDSLYSARFTLSNTTQVPAGLPIRITTQMRRRDGFETLPMTDFDSIGANTYVLPRLAPGVYKIRVTWGPGYTVEPSADLIATIADRDVDLGTLSIGPVRTITGRVTALDNSRPIPQGLDRVTITRLDQPIGGPGVPLAADGRFTIQLPEGRYHIGVPGLPADSYIGSVQYGDKEMLGTGLVIDSDPQGPVQIRVASGTGDIQGTVHNAKGERIYSAKVSLWPVASVRANPEWAQTTGTDVEGTFTFSKVPPGDYRVVAVEAILPFAQVAFSVFAGTDVGFLSQFEKQATRILVEPGIRKSVDLQIIHNYK